MSLSISNNSNRLPQDALAEIFVLSGKWEDPIPCVCKEWSDTFKATRNQWTILTGLIAHKTLPRYLWWQQQINTVKNRNLLDAPMATLMRDLDVLITERSNPHCVRILEETSRPGRDQDNLLSLVNPNLLEDVRRGRMSRFVAQVLGKGLIVQLNQRCNDFVSAVVQQTNPGANFEFDRELLIGARWNGYFIGPAFPSQRSDYLRIIQTVAPAFCRWARQGSHVVHLSVQKRMALNQCLTQYGANLRCTMGSLREWRTQNLEILQQRVFTNNLLIEKIYSFAPNPNLGLVCWRFVNLVFAQVLRGNPSLSRHELSARRTAAASNNPAPRPEDDSLVTIYYV